MGVGQWMKVVDTVSTLAQMGARFRRSSTTEVAQSGSPLEQRLAGVVVAALKEAFDRDRARTDLERETLEADRSRAERALQAELRRQAADRALTQLRLMTIFAGLVLLMSSVLAAWIGGMRIGAPAWLLTAGWAMALGTLGCVFAAWQQIIAWAAAPDPPQTATVTGTEGERVKVPRRGPGVPADQVSSLAATAPWLLLASLMFVAASLLLAR